MADAYLLEAGVDRYLLEDGSGVYLIEPPIVAPTFIQEAETSGWNDTSPKTTASFSVLAGDVLVAFAVTEDDLDTVSVAGGSLTWTQQQTASLTDYTWVSVWTATVDVNKSMTVTFTRDTGVGWFGGNVLTFRGSDGIGASNKANNASGAPSVNITTQQGNSAVVVVSGDWTATDGASRTWLTNAGALTEQTYFRDAARYALYGGYHANAGAAGTYAVGLSAPTGQKYQIIALEVKGAPAAGGGGSFTLTAESGAFTMTGTAAGLRAGRKIIAAAASYTVSGTAATLRVERKLSAASGTYSVTGTAAGLTAARRLTASPGSFVWTGTSAGFSKAFQIVADAGAFNVTGTAADLRVQRRLSAEAGSYAMAGSPANLRAARRLAVDSGTYAWTGTAAGLLVARRLSAASGTFVWTGTEATLLGPGARLLAEPGVFTMTGVPAYAILRLASFPASGSGPAVVIIND